MLTSNKDDRVHPAQGRKAAARLAALGQPYYCYENIDGGHSAAANLTDTRAGWHSNTPMHPAGLWIECG
ncbi:hypothetical protein [Bradyrhizobium sp. 145]|uniref:hypothetical protein n=1 Tax=Bradyrhizobium sp. 145 TaxID=2782621 RepID=UPI0032119A06